MLAWAGVEHTIVITDRIIAIFRREGNRHNFQLTTSTVWFLLRNIKALISLAAVTPTGKESPNTETRSRLPASFSIHILIFQMLMPPACLRFYSKGKLRVPQPSQLGDRPVVLKTLRREGFLLLICPT
ncbi:Hypothetical protein NTJ_00801 [Nesidiocoris tenuis]|uniref:Uncharacterized protein n=1 Tax=Nesidiocoris tenuis TaxID=355587 RepID=A0ABN7A784_9HEMI|nr:Hypothetical protein NTJ_00801 [Nesidiocoris tenuis]